MHSLIIAGIGSWVGKSALDQNAKGKINPLNFYLITHLEMKGIQTEVIVGYVARVGD